MQLAHIHMAAASRTWASLDRYLRELSRSEVTHFKYFSTDLFEDSTTIPIRVTWAYDWPVSCVDISIPEISLQCQVAVFAEVR